MNMVLRDLSGWRCEKLTEHSAVLHLNAFTQVICHVQQKRLFMASIHSCEFRVKGTIELSFAGQNSRSSARMAETLSRHFLLAAKVPPG